MSENDTDAVNAVTCIVGTISVVCSVIVILTFVLIKEIRTVTRQIITCITISDLFTSFSNMLHTFYRAKDNNRNETRQLCTVQSFISSTSSLWSFLWTTVFSIALYLVLVKENIRLLKKLMPWFHIFCWLVPLAINLAALILKRLGSDSSQASTGGWCWIVVDDHPRSETITWMLVDGKAIEISTYVVITFMYIFIKIKLKGKIRSESSSNLSLKIKDENKLQAMKTLYNKLLFIPLLLVFFRIWGTIRFLIFAISKKADQHTSLKVLQAIGDSSQAIGNFLLFCIFTPKIRKEMILKAKKCYSRRNSSLNSTEADERTRLMEAPTLFEDLE